MSLNYTQKQRERIATADKIYISRRKGNDGRYRLEISDKRGSIKRVLWKPSKDQTIKAARQDLADFEQEAREAKKRREAQNQVASLTWEEENTDNKSRAYMEIRVVVEPNEELPETQKDIIEFARRKLTGDDKRKVTLWADIFEQHGVVPRVNKGVTTEDPKIGVELSVTEEDGRKEREQLTLEKFL